MYTQRSADARGWQRGFFFFQAEDGIRDSSVTGVQTCALPIYITLKKTATNLWRRPTLRRERGAPGDAGIRPVTCGKQWDLLTARIDAATREAIANLVEERPQHGGYTATHDHHFRFQQVHDVADPQRQEFDGLLQYAGGERITGDVGLADLFTGDGGNGPVSEAKNARAVSKVFCKFFARS